LGDRYRAVAFAFGTGVVRTRPAMAGLRGGGEPGLSDVPVREIIPDSYEDILGRATPEGYWLDVRALPADAAGQWLRGPRAMRLVTEVYASAAPQAFQATVELPANFDAVVFAKRVTAAKQ